MNKAEILGLAARVEALEGPDREVDCLIKQAVGDPWDYAADWGPRDNCKPVGKPYTSSIDAAMGLVPEGWVIGQMSWWPHAKSATVHMDDMHSMKACSGATSLPAALTAAALRATASTMEDDRG